MRKFIKFLLLAFAGSLVTLIGTEPAQAQFANFNVVSKNNTTKTVSVRASVALNLCTPTGLWRFTWGDDDHTDIGHNITAIYSHPYDDWGTHTITLFYDCHEISTPRNTSLRITLVQPTATPSPTPVLTVSFDTLAHYKGRVYIITDTLPDASVICTFSGALTGQIYCPNGALVSNSIDGCGTVTVTASATLGSQKASATGQAVVPCNPTPMPTAPASGSAAIDVTSQNDPDRSVSVDITLDGCTGTGTWSIDWGDDETSNVASPYSGQFDHTYADWGLFDITLTYTCVGGSQADAETTVGLAHPTPTPTPTATLPVALPSGPSGVIPTATSSNPCLPAGVSVRSETPWISYCVVGDDGVGIKWIIEAGYMEAIDFWGPQDAQVQANVCFNGVGALLLLDATYYPRRPVWLQSTLRYGKTCAQLDRTGTVIFMPGSPTFMLQTATPTVSGPPEPNQVADSPNLVTPLENCLVNSVTALNFREQPGGHILGRYDGRSVAVARTPNWFKVQYMGREGWISAHYVTTEGDCG